MLSKQILQKSKYLRNNIKCIYGTNYSLPILACKHFCSQSRKPKDPSTASTAKDTYANSEQEPAGDKQQQKVEAETEEEAQGNASDSRSFFMRVHPWWYFASAMITVYQFLRMNDIASEFDDLVAYAGDVQFEILDVLVKLKAAEDEHVMIAILNEDQIDGRMLDVENEADKRVRKIVEMVTDSRFKRLSYALIFSNFCAIVAQTMFNLERGIGVKSGM